MLELSIAQLSVIDWITSHGCMVALPFGSALMVIFFEIMVGAVWSLSHGFRASLVTVIIYFLVDIKSAAVTAMSIVLLPTASGIAADAVPLATVVPFPFIVAPASAAVGVTVIEVVLFATDAL
jgi:hypothetical protein